MPANGRGTWGCLFPRGVPGLGGAWSGGPGPGGCLLLGSAWWRPRPGRLLLPAVRIPLECILVEKEIMKFFY